MIIYNAITAICLAFMILATVIIVGSLVKRERSDRIEYIRTFKKGKVFIIYIIAIPLYLIGHIYAGQDFLVAFFNAVNKIVNLVVLKYDVTSIEKLMNGNAFYASTVFVCFWLIGLNAILFSLSVFGQVVWSVIQQKKFEYSKKRKLILFGYNDDNLSIYKSDEKAVKIICDSIKSEDRDYLYSQKIVYKHSKNYIIALDKFLSNFSKKTQRYIMVINTHSDDRNIEIARYIVEYMDANPQKCPLFFDNLRVLVFGEPKYETIYGTIEKDGYGCISYVNKYQRVAIDFIDCYPLTKFMDERHIDYDTALVKKGVDINVLMIGYGKTNQQIFITSVANNQFLTKENDGIKLKKVNYYLYDKENSKHNKNLNHTYFRYENEFLPNATGEYLPLPDCPAEEYFKKLDVNDYSFYNSIKEIVNKSENDINYAIIAYGSDLENIDLAQKLIAKSIEWGIDNLYIFVKVRKGHEDNSIFDEKKCFRIANESKSIFDIDKILRDKLTTMSKLRNAVYDLEYCVSNDKDFVVSSKAVEESKKRADKKWYSDLSQLQRESSLFCCLSVRSKLNLLGFDYCDKEDKEKPDASEEFLAVYTKGDPIESHDGLLVDGKKVVKYTLKFKDSVRKTFAVHEHYRWNSFMLSKGIIPASKEQILTEKINGKFTNGKNFDARRHGNLTTFEGLEEFRRLIANRDGALEESKDVIKYDYQIMDDLVWLLDKSGYKIIKK